jgi:hypothetical protein
VEPEPEGEEEEEEEDEPILNDDLLDEESTDDEMRP